MSYNTESSESYAFGVADAQMKPRLACIGYVSEVGEGHISQSGYYVVQPVRLEALDAGQSTKVQVLYRPEWLTHTFKPKTLKDGDEQTQKSHFVYQKNIRVNSGISVLQGLCGTDEAFGDFMNKTARLPKAEGTEGPSIEDVQKCWTEFFDGNRNADGTPAQVGYILRQRRTKSDEVDENGKPVYILEDGYEVESFFYVNDKTIGQLRRRAEGGTEAMLVVPLTKR